ncbi:Acetylornithine deacetylase [Hartmannibacter diazotrophicus]|uniref:Acetylornithine deacetylase n=1 Tax=Hartmannibacter diazotrophicus TaxID=1482074 RepID=A0A2C9D4A3_9HYPH|nr:acetylornithine deacetylase [Hartmannibacter diazotrophicus]SON54998.1 Acetylornithine deacetylase [Hartmannibacter diazotrophicus]
MTIDTAVTKAILETLVGFDTTSRNSNLDLIAWVEDYLSRHGIDSERVYDETGEKANLFATIGPADAPGYILSGHTDVVPVDGQPWSSDPFVLREESGKLYGRGACDMKGFLAVCLAAVPMLKSKPLKTPIHLAFSYDEEVGCIGVRGLIDALKSRPLLPLACFVGEPTEMQVVTAHKAKRSLRVTVTGLSCHSSLAPHGVNAVEYAARLIGKIGEVGAQLARGPSDALFDVPVTTTHVGTISGGTVLNIVPDECQFTFEIRALPRQDADALLQEIEVYAREVLVPEMRMRHPEAGIDFEITSAFPGLDTEPDAEVTRLAKRLAGRNDHAKVAYGTEAGLFDEAGIPTVVVGPGSIGEAHKPDEFIAISELEKCAAFIERLAEKACDG